TSTFRAARRLRRRCCTACCCCRRRSGASERSSGDPMIDEALDSLGRAIAGALPGAVGSYALTRGELTLVANAAGIVPVMTFLRDDPACAFHAFIDLTAVDWPQRERRFDVVYHLLSPTRNHRIRVRI